MCLHVTVTVECYDLMMTVTVECYDLMMNHLGDLRLLLYWYWHLTFALAPDVTFALASDLCSGI